MDSNHPPFTRKSPPGSQGVDPGEMAFVVLDGMAEAAYVLDSDWRIVFGNQAFVQHMGRPRSELIGQTIWDVIAPQQHDLLRSAFARMRDSGGVENFTQTSVVHTGRTVDVRVFPVLDGLAVVFRDITRKIANEQALATSEAHLRLALDGARMGDWAWNAATDVMTLSDRALSLYGLKPEDQGITRTELRRRLLHPDDVEAMRVAADQAYSERSLYDFEYRVRYGDDWRWMRVMGGPYVVDGAVVGVHGLVQDIDKRKRDSDRLQAEIEEREKSQQRQQLLIHELNHRVKNILAMVQAMAAQTLSTAATPQAARAALESRLIALAQAHDVLTRESWDGAELLDIITGAVAPHELQTGFRFRIEGPRVRLEPKTAVSLAMALHELATNAIKYGALSSNDGWVEINWTVQPVAAGIDLRLSWVERDGPEVKAPDHKGFGSRLIARSLASEGGVAELSYPPEGARCQINVVLPAL